MIRGVLAAVQLGLLDMRGDIRRFGLLVVCLAVGTALIAGVSTVGDSIRQAVERDAAVIVGGDVELSRADRPGTADELAKIGALLRERIQEVRRLACAARRHQDERRTQQNF